MTNTELIRQEIERRIGAMYNFSSGYSALNVCRELLDFIDSLPEEQPEVDLEKEINHYFFDFKDPDTDEMIPEEECSLDIPQARKLARHFYELGLNARK